MSTFLWRKRERKNNPATWITLAKKLLLGHVTCFFAVSIDNNVAVESNFAWTHLECIVCMYVFLLTFGECLDCGKGHTYLISNDIASTSTVARDVVVLATKFCDTSYVRVWIAMHCTFINPSKPPPPRNLDEQYSKHEHRRERTMYGYDTTSTQVLVRCWIPVWSTDCIHRHRMWYDSERLSW